MPSRLAKLKQITRITRDHKDVYRGMTDVAKSFVLRYATTHYQVASALCWLKTMSLRIDCLPGRVHVRLPGSDFFVLREIFELNEYTAARKWTLPADARIIDLGGNIGLASLFFTCLAPEARFLVVEPDEGNCGMIRWNCRRLIEADRMQLVRGFVAEHDGVASLDRSGKEWAFQKVDQVDERDEAIPCFSMPTLIEKSGFERIDLIKCDVEGTEAELFRDCRPWIGKVDHLIVEVHQKYHLPDLYEALRSNGWDFDLFEERFDDTCGIAFMRRKGAGDLAS